MTLARPIVFSDLDDTLFQTARKMPGAPDPERLACLALNDSHSYMSDTQAMMVDWLLATTRLIPVTARSTEALSRCRIAFHDHRICTNGAVILLPGGTPDPEWQARMEQVAQAAAPRLAALLAHVRDETEPGQFRCWIVEEFGTGYYFCIKSNGEAEALDTVDAQLASLAGATMARHRNDNNLAFTPIGISKRNAVEYLSTRLLRDGPVPVFGMGDSLSDLPFMAGCDMMVVPARSQIARTRLCTPPSTGAP